MINIFSKKKILYFYKIKFYDWSFNKIINKINAGGYLVAPAASALVEIEKNKIYYESLKKSTCAIYDSGFFCILLRLFGIYSPKKLSGYLFLKNFLNYKKSKKKKILLINSSDYQGEENKILFYKKGFKEILLYTAPIYKSIHVKDQIVMNLINKYRPKYILISIGGLKQEPLAFYITKNIKIKCTILCLGGAIDFITGLQAPINIFVDKIYLGWLFRIIYNPKVFFIRVLKSLYLFKYFWRKNY